MNLSNTIQIHTPVQRGNSGNSGGLSPIVYTGWFKYGRPVLISKRIYHLMDQCKAGRGGKATEWEWANSSILHSNSQASIVSIRAQK